MLQQQQQQPQQTQPQDNNPTTNITHPPISVKPVPMTRTQFFGLDNLPSPTADRKSNVSVSSLTFKPDLPQKPKIPKRPMVLGLTTTTNIGLPTVGGGNVSGSANKIGDEESTPTNNTSDSIQSTNGTLLRGNKTAEQLVQEHCDNVTALKANIGSSNTSIPSALLKETNHNNHFQFNNHSNLEVNANAMLAQPSPPAVPPPPAVAVAKVMTSNTNTSSTTTTASASTVASSNITTTDKPLVDVRLTTPTTPISPNMMTPKRPTVSAPPPPTNVKKQV